MEYSARSPNACYIRRSQGRALVKRLVAGFYCDGPGSRPIRSCGICGGQSGTGAGFLRVLRFPLPAIIPPNFPHS
jgi:hypothetical protein